MSITAALKGINQQVTYWVTDKIPSLISGMQGRKQLSHSKTKHNTQKVAPSADKRLTTNYNPENYNCHLLICSICKPVSHYKSPYTASCLFVTYTTKHQHPTWSSTISTHPLKVSLTAMASLDDILECIQPCKNQRQHFDTCTLLTLFL